MMTTRETNTTHDHSPDDPQTTFTSRIASVMRRGNGRTGVLTFLSNLVRTPGECTQVWDINNSQHSDTLMVNIAESSNNNDSLQNNAFLRAHNAQYNSEGYTIPDEIGTDFDIYDMELYDIGEGTYIVSRADPNNLSLIPMSGVQLEGQYHAHSFRSHVISHDRSCVMCP